MKEMKLVQMEEITGGTNRACMIAGGIAFFSGIAGFAYAPFWVLAASTVVVAAFYGCFD